MTYVIKSHDRSSFLAPAEREKGERKMKKGKNIPSLRLSMTYVILDMTYVMLIYLSIVTLWSVKQTC